MRTLKLIAFKFIFFLIFFNQIVFSKSLPPGTGVGDVPVNILLLLDTSQSMTSKPLTGEGIDDPESLVLLNDGVLVGQSPGIEKYNTAEKIKDVTFNDNKKIFVGEPKDDCQLDGVQNTNIGRAMSMDVSSKVEGMLGEEVIYVAADSQQKVVLIKPNGDCIEVIDRADLGIVHTAHSTDKRKPVGLNIRTIDGEDHLLITGREEWCKVVKNKSKCKTKGSTFPYVYSKNLTTGFSKVCSNTGKFSFLNFSESITMNKDYLYAIHSDQIYRVPLEKQGDVYCPSKDTHDHVFTITNSPINIPAAIEVDPQESNVMYVVSSASSTLQKLTILNKTLTEKIVIGNGSASCSATKNAAATDIKSVSICKPLAIFVGNDRLWLGGEKASIQEFNIEDDDQISWIQEMGSSKVSRLKGAVQAIEAVVEDSSLTQGANFGFGIWNAGEQICKKGKAKWLWEKGCEYPCGKELTYKGNQSWKRPKSCHYYKSWKKPEALSSSDKKKHPFGKSSLCNDNSCIKVGIDEKTSENIKYHLGTIKPRYGTDARAFSQLAYKYFTENQLNIVDDTIPCQLNYAIIISDGKWVRHDYALDKIKQLRHETGVKTLVVAYGDLAVNEDTLPTFNEMALAGTCDPDTAGTAGECRGVIEAPTPGMLLTKLKSEIQRIIASRLSFTAPSITATIQEGGDLYQAQFEYMRDGEWKGSLIRKQIKEDGSVEHDPDATGNWDSADKIKEQALSNKRKIWTVLPSAPYTTNYNNFTTENSAAINVLFETLGETVTDLHNSTSRCKGEAGAGGETVKDDILDDINGLINFVRGKDYFGYGGCENLSGVREHVLGDIYHSQIVEVGPPNASVSFTKNNQEAYFRSTRNYASFARTHSNRDRILYVGANDGMLHAIRATSSGGSAGEELWAFVPPFIAAKLPTMINEALDGIGLNNTQGGSNSIFSVDGSPVVHDMYIRGLREDGTYQGEGQKSWHTILFIPYGRGGKGFSVLDITRSEKPLHMFSVYNDTRNQVVLIADKDGNMYPHNYQSGSLRMGDALEAERSRTNYEIAERKDSDDDTTEIDKIAKCQSNADSTTGSFHVNGSNSCFTGKTWTFDFKAPEEIFSDFSKLSVIATNEILEDIPVKVNNISKDGPYTKIEFDTSFAYSFGESDLTDLPTESSFTIRWDTAGTDEKEFDYSTLGETWAAPRIVRIAQSDKVSEDQYVAVLAGGFGTDGHMGSSLFLIDLNDTETNYGKIYGAEKNNGPIKIIDLEQDPNVANAIPGDPVVITPDTFKGVNWRGAMVYLADIEGKITKINLTNDEDANLYDQTTLFSLNTSRENGRYMYFGMDAAYGNDTKNLWLFGGTGDFTKIAARSKGMDNVIFGIRDRHFPKFVHLNEVNIGLATTTDSETNALISNDAFVKAATDGAKAAKNIDQSNYCVNTADGDLSSECPGQEHDAWIFKLDKPSDKSLDVEPKTEGRKNKDRKASSSPTVFGGNVYYPIYEPPTGASLCNVGNAFVCSADDECGINNSKEIDYVRKSVGTDSGYDEESGCYYLQPGILSKLVVFGNTLYGNITTESSEQKDTLVTLLANEGEVSLYRGSWRENY